jgi:hypothetical protein
MSTSPLADTNREAGAGRGSVALVHTQSCANELSPTYTQAL